VLVDCETIKYTCMHSAKQKRASLTIPCTKSEYEKSLSLSEKEGWKIDVCMLYINQVIVPLRGGARRKNYTVCMVLCDVREPNNNNKPPPPLARSLARAPRQYVLLFLLILIKIMDS
jgi:hypothetical protein